MIKFKWSTRKKAILYIDTVIEQGRNSFVRLLHCIRFLFILVLSHSSFLEIKIAQPTKKNSFYGIIGPKKKMQAKDCEEDRKQLK